MKHQLLLQLQVQMMGVHVSKPTDQIHAHLYKKKYGEKEDFFIYFFFLIQELFHKNNWEIQQ